MLSDGGTKRKSKRFSFAGDASGGSTLRTGVAINKLTSDMQWVERRISLNEDGSALKISTKKMLSCDTEIPISNITYVQVGSEELEEAHRELIEPKKTINASTASIFISAGDMSVRIRLPDDITAASVAAELRALM